MVKNLRAVRKIRPIELDHAKKYGFDIVKITKRDLAISLIQDLSDEDFDYIFGVSILNVDEKQEEELYDKMIANPTTYNTERFKHLIHLKEENLIEVELNFNYNTP